MMRPRWSSLLAVVAVSMLALGSDTGLGFEPRREPTGEGVFLVPLLDLGADWQTELWLANSEDRAARVRVALLSPAMPSLEGTFTFELAPGESRTLGAEVLMPGTTLARVESDRRLSGGARLRHSSGDRTLELGSVDELSREHRASGAGLTIRELALLNPHPERVRVTQSGGRSREVGPFETLRVAPGEGETLAERPLLAVEVTRDAEGEVVALESTDAAWIWPVADDDRKSLGQGYATFNGMGDNRYHTGLDIGYSRGTSVRFVASGTLVRVQRLHKNDHGFGNSVVARHRTISGSDVYVQYSHLDSIDSRVLSRCGPADASQRSSCSGSVSAGTTVGAVGGSGNGSLTHWTPHLHLEAKSFWTLSAPGDDNGGREYGYAWQHPDSRGAAWPAGARYYDPLTVGFHAVSPLAATSRLAREGGTVHIGPGGLDDWTAGYRPIAPLVKGATYRVLARAFEPYCPSGTWVQVQGATDFGFWGLATGKQRDAWTCESHLEGGSSPAPSPTPTPTPTPAPTSQPPQITSIAPSTVVGSSFDLTIQGQRFDTTGARDEVYAPNGNYMGAGVVSSRTLTRIVTRESMAGAAPGYYTVRVRATGGLSNAVTLRLVDEVAVSPPSGVRGTRFSYTGRGFTGGYGVSSHLRRPDGVEYPTLQIATAPNGTFSWSVDSSSFSPGQWQLWAVDNNTSVASNRISFTVQ